MSRIINFGIAGCGIIGNTHAQSVKAIPELGAVAACCDPVPERAREFAEKFGCTASTHWRPCWTTKVWTASASALPAECTGTP